MYREDSRHLGPLTALGICDRTWNDGSQSCIGLTPMILESQRDPELPVYLAYTVLYFPSQAEIYSMRAEDTKNGFNDSMCLSRSAYAKAKYLTGSEDWHRSIDTVITKFVRDMVSIRIQHTGWASLINRGPAATTNSCPDCRNNCRKSLDSKSEIMDPSW